MKNKTRFQKVTLLALNSLTLTTLACTKSDSLGKVGGKDGGADAAPDVGMSTAPDGNGCQTTNANPSTCDAPPASGTPDVTIPLGCQYPSESHVNASGDTVWTWRFHWQDPSYWSSCSAWGADAKMVLEVDFPANPSGSGTSLPTCSSAMLSTGAGPTCTMANAWRFETACTDGQLLVELPSLNTFHGYYHLESSAYPSSPRNLVSQDVHCSRDLYLAAGFGSPPSTGNDGGVDAASDGNTCSAGLIHYATPGCGAAAVPTCETTGDASFSPSSFCACDGVTTLTYDARGVRTPYLYADACKQDGGSSVAAAEIGAEASTDCACVRPNSLTWSQTTWDCYCSVHDCTVNQSAFTASLSAYGWSTDDYANCDLRVLSFKFSGGTDRASTRTFQLSSGKMVGAFDIADTGVQCPFEDPDAGRLLGLLAGTQIDTSCVRSATSCPDAGASSCFR